MPLDFITQGFRLSPARLHVLLAAAVLILAVALGLGLNLLFRRAAKGHPKAWGQLVYSLLQSLSLPLLILAALYGDLVMLTLPRRLEHIGAELISAFTILFACYFPAKVLVLFLNRIGARRPDVARFTQFLASITRAGFLLLAVYTLVEVLTLPRRYERFGSRLVGALGIAVVFFALSRLVVLYLRRLNQQDAALRRVTEPAVFVTRIVFGLLAVIIILDNLGIHLTTVWATLGVGSVAVALALQDTLGNLFAGLYILADRPIGLGDYIKLDSGQEGYVVRIGWRSTLMRALANNLIVVPNSTLAKAVIINYSKPEDRMAIGIQVSVTYGTDPQRVDEILTEVAKQAARDGVDGLLATPAPNVRFLPGFGASSLDFTLNVHVRAFVDQYLVQSELRKRILQRFQREGIEMPFPTRTIILDKATLHALRRYGAPTAGENG